ncbi:aspartyl/asparaginyl beta-hydroxylase domain-containing protein [Burkholderia cepacia]|uniref:aspartyl/asparaginyl beta-hydroxylase domain-containing protein n=1 Tax=Burkholderia cepacia TaxID=292 RepID=UPI000F5D8A2D|nr:aspartyl/asparaginyl beta-hydroxylase domain-containing protein [Burkholderia cepacia]RQZ57421.1 aspartyl/asparaginyl beta-hydroxylase domain-containing protein [Burkholderia cepacia]
MRNFLKVAEGADVTPLLIALQHRPDLWSTDAVRQTFAESPHRDVQDILLRFSDTSSEHIGDELICEDTEAYRVLHVARPLVFAVMARVQGVMLGRVLITRLAPGKRIHPHSDVLGRYANTYNRFHIPLQSAPGCVFRAGDEHVYMRPGEVWDFNAHAEHEVINNSDEDRIHLIVDIKR